MLFGDGVDQRNVHWNVDGTPDPGQLAPRRHERTRNNHDDHPPDQTEDDEESRHDRGQASRFIRIDP